MTSKGGYSNKTIINNRKCSVGSDQSDIIRKAIRELSFIAYYNMSITDALNAFNQGLQDAELTLLEEQNIPF